MIGVRLEGGLGNQMFQYAAARALAHRHDAGVVFDTSFYETSPNRFFLLDRLGVAARKTHPGELAGMRAYREKSFTWDAVFEELPDGTLLEGYWQSGRYFSGIRESLLEELKPKAPLGAAAQNIADLILGSEAVSLHVRRGDYAADPTTRRYHGLCGIDYYKEAVARITESRPRAHFFLFSDDAEWTRQNILPWVPRAVVAGPHAREEEDLRLMSLCRYHITANSSFSWWGAWLSQNADKIVYAPKKWFAGADLDTSDLIPASWTRL